MKYSQLVKIRQTNQPVLISGHSGFKGTWLTQILEKLGIPYVGISRIDSSETFYRRNDIVSSGLNYFFDLRETEKVAEVLKETNPVGVIHLAAQPLVIESYRNTPETFSNNIMSTVSLLEAIRTCESVKAIVVSTTDKVYMNENKSKKFSENDALKGVDPYSASKVAVESVVSAYRNIFMKENDKKLIAVRAGNVIGGGDVGRNRLIPDIIKAFQFNETMILRNPESTRPWLHVIDPLIGYLHTLEYLLNSDNCVEALNFGPNVKSSLTVLEVVEAMKTFINFQYEIDESDYLGKVYEAKYLDLDSSLSASILGWKPKVDSQLAIQLTANWWNRIYSEENPQSIMQDQLSEILR